MDVPTGYVSPASPVRWTTPDAAASISFSTLSVSSRYKGCPTETTSPSSTNHSTSVPSVIPNPSFGILISAMPSNPRDFPRPGVPGASAPGCLGSGGCPTAGGGLEFPQLDDVVEGNEGVD